MNPQEAYELVDDFEKSEGWLYVREVMRGEVMQAAFSLADESITEPETINFRRGALWAAQRLLELPTRLKTNLETELIMKKAQEETQ
ncbi:MAG: hypothetical protein QF577_06980 [Phycisphaerae bacterium]|jgi:hypothetical protein|nr:hypothetical protein [Phycisphaerae bacterium]